jgi:predicted PurR-regulated permease PerM
MFKLFKRGGDELPAVEVTISTQTVLRVLCLIVAVVVLIVAVQAASSALILICTAFFLSLALNHPVHLIAKSLPGSLKGKRSVATTISFVIVVALFAAFIASIAPPLVRQTESFISSAPQLIRDAHDQNSEVGKFIRRYNLESQLDSLSDEITSRLKNSGGTAVHTVSKIGSSIFAVLTILVLTFMMLIEGPRILEFFRELVPDRNRTHVEKVSMDMYRVIRGFINGQVTLAALAAILILPGLFLFHVSYPIALMVVIFICGLIPMVGHTIGATIVTIVALFTSPLSALSILIYYILYQQIENYLVQPRIQANSTDMSPLLVFSSVIIGITFGGLFGGLFAIPVAGCIRILVLDFLATRGYIDRPAPIIKDTINKAKSPKQSTPNNPAAGGEPA